MTWNIGTAGASDFYCLTPKCERPAAARGVCAPCYQALLRMVNKGQTTWEKLEINGNTRPSKRRLSPAYIAARTSATRTA